MGALGCPWAEPSIVQSMQDLVLAVMLRSLTSQNAKEHSRDAHKKANKHAHSLPVDDDEHIETLLSHSSILYFKVSRLLGGRYDTQHIC